MIAGAAGQRLSSLETASAKCAEALFLLDEPGICKRTRSLWKAGATSWKD